MGGMFVDVFSSTKECLFVDGMFMDVFSSTEECLCVDGMSGDVVNGYRVPRKICLLPGGPARRSRVKPALRRVCFTVPLLQ